MPDRALSKSSCAAYLDEIMSISEHGSDTDENSSVHQEIPAGPSPKSGTLSSQGEAASRQKDGEKEDDDTQRQLTFRPIKRHKYQEFLHDLGETSRFDFKKTFISEVAGRGDDSTIEIEEQNRPEPDMNVKMTAFNYIPMDERPGQKPIVDRRTVRERVTADIKETRSYACAITLEDRRRYDDCGIEVGTDRIAPDTKERAHIRTAERNHYPGQMFAEGIYLWWKGMKFKDRLIDEIENLCRDKVARAKSVKECRRKKLAKLKAGYEAYLASLSPL